MKEFIKKRPIISVGVITFFIICIPIGFYITFFWNTSISQDAGNWGTFGDYFGGTLNPILGFISFMALLYTIKLQRDSIELQNQELQATREELAKSAKAQEASEKALAEQSNIFRQQQFETTFFSMLAHLHQLAAALPQEKIIENKLIQTPVQYGLYSLNNALDGKIPLIHFLKNIDFIPDPSYIHIYEKQRKEKECIEEMQNFIDSNYPNWNQFSLFLYEILKLIRTLSPIKSDSCSTEEKRYSNIVRASTHPNMLQILAITTHRTDKESYMEYTELLERYAFLETMPFKIHDYFRPPLLACIFLYQAKAFGNSEYLKELDKIKTEYIRENPNTISQPETAPPTPPQSAP
ncbi:MAG: putative phage abortive infection protein [Conchiformibius sp.]|nr:putative phage abortive infection protein [Conchiformibius sp.]